jgi:hypothetical protein
MIIPKIKFQTTMRRFKVFFLLKMKLLKMKFRIIFLFIVILIC